jgi:preprotein translocase subunit YajC
VQSVLFAAFALLAEDAPAADAPVGNPWLQMAPFILLMVAMFYFLIIRPQQREQARRNALLSGVKKNDKVMTTSGIYGVVTNADREADEVTVRVDDTTNTKLRMSFTAIAHIIEKDDSSGKDPASKEK